MKSLFLFIFTCCMMLSNIHTTQAQNIAPDFTVTDINGNSHNLYTYIGQGKTVFLDFSTTWCSPCWSVHQTHALDYAHRLYGPNGSGEVVVLFMESDDGTTMADLQGTTSNTQGDWITGTSYPIVDNASNIAEAYNVNGYPTLLKVCQDTVITVLDDYEDLEIPTVKSFLESGNNCSSIQGVSNTPMLEQKEIFSCVIGNSPTGKANFSVKNMGNNVVNTLTVELKANGNTVATETFTEDIALLETKRFFLSSVTMDTSAAYTINITAANGATPHVADWATSKVTKTFSGKASQYISIEIATDESSSADGGSAWEIKDANGTIVVSGKNYPNNTKDTIHHELPAGENCYSVHMHDGYGDGWGLEGGIKIKSEGIYVFEAFGREFKEYINPAAFKTSIVSSNEEIASSSWNIFPNPTKNVVNIQVSLEQKSEVSLVDIHGRVVMKETASKGNDNVKLDVTNLPRGVYFVHLTSNDKVATKKVTLH